MICDKLAAGMAYKGKDFTPQYELDYWNVERTKIRVNPKTQDFVTEVLTQITKKGINKTLNKHNMVVLYKKYCG